MAETVKAARTGRRRAPASLCDALRRWCARLLSAKAAPPFARAPYLSNVGPIGMGFPGGRGKQRDAVCSRFVGFLPPHGQRATVPHVGRELRG